MDQKITFELNKQILTSFPNLNEKHIDYVIVYKVLDEITENEECLKTRDEFFKQLQKESFDIYNITTEEKLIYCLLHCQTNRLLHEAENIHLRMQLKNVLIILKTLNRAFNFIR